MNIQSFSSEQELRSAFQQGIFFHYFQPIVNLITNEVIGYEGLLRSRSVQNPLSLFQMAKEQNKLNTFDLLSFEWAIKSVPVLNKVYDYSLFLNLFPSTISLPFFSEFIRYISSQNDNHWKIVLEISELESIDNFSQFKQSIDEVQRMNTAIAIDDIGSGSSPFRKFIELEPNYVKLDRYFSQDLHLSVKKQQLIQLFLQYFGNFNAKIILEGIEKPEELLTAKKLGIPYGQGFLLGKPVRKEDNFS